MTDGDGGRDEVRERILRATLKLIAKGGVEAATTRAVSAAAGVQAPTIYRHFGDKRGLLDAAGVQAVTAFVTGKGALKPAADPVEDLRQGWDRQVAFGLANPGVFAVMRAEGRSGEMSEALAAGERMLREKVRRVALAGRLRVSEARAVTLVHATGMGVIEALLAQPAEARDLEVSAMAREAVLAAITTRAVAKGKAGVTGAANVLLASLGEVEGLTRGERALMGELLERIARSSL